MLAVSAALYYATYSFPDRYDMESRFTPVPSRMNNTPPPPPISATGDVVGRKIWNILNPQDDPLLFIKIEPPTIVELTVSTSSHPQTERRHQSRFFASRMTSPLYRLMRIVILPSVATNFLLYILVQYLQKDPELVAAQRHREDADRPSKPRTNQVEGNVSFTPLLRACSQNVELIAHSQDTSVIAAISENELAIWFEDGSHLTLDTNHVLASHTRPVGTITTLAIDPTGANCAVGTSDGILGVWSITSSSLVFQVCTHVPGRICSVQFGYATSASLHSRSQLSDRRFLALTISTTDGDAYTWDFLSSPLPSKLVDGPFQSSPALVSLPSLNIYTEEATVNSPTDGNLSTIHSARMSGLGFTDPIVSALPQRPQVGGVRVPILVLTTQCGQVCIFNEDSKELIGVVEVRRSAINRIRIIGLSARECMKCANNCDDALVIALETEEVLKIYHLPFLTEGKICPCLRPDLLDMHQVVPDGSLSRHTSMTLTSTTPPLTRPQSFPVPLPTASIGSTTSSSRRLRSATWITDVSIERGSWDANGNLILGVRRRSQTLLQASSHGNPSNKQPRPRSPFDRWELWSLDPYGSLRVSPISALSSHTDSSDTRSSRSSSFSELFFHPPPHPAPKPPPASTRSTFPRIPFTKAGPFLSATPSISITSFGNTVGIFRFS